MTEPMTPDPRWIENGLLIPSEAYADQPYIVETDDGAWLCAVTTGPGHEGQTGQHVVSRRSTDHGQTWSDPVDIEPSDGPEASYAVLLKTHFGRVYCFYNYNLANRRELLYEDGKTVCSRVDSLGQYVFRFSDDHGLSWSPGRHIVPVREFACDRENVYGGRVRFFWNVGRPLCLGDSVLLVLHKVGAMGEGFFAQSEGCFLFSDNILTEGDPERVRFETRPDGDVGLRTPEGGGRVAEEQSIAGLSNGSVFCVYRTVDGWPTCAYSSDQGRTWTPPRYLTYTPSGPRRVKHPRAANFVWNADPGRFLYWFHNHGGRFIRQLGGDSSRTDRLSETNNATPYDDRNPAWLMAGREVSTPDGLRIEWSQPEIALYDDDPFVRMSYPDLLQQDGRFWITETQKHHARVHELDARLLDGLFNQWDACRVTREGLVLDLPGADGPMPCQCPMPVLPDVMCRDGSSFSYGRRDLRQGFSVEIVFELDSLGVGHILMDSRTEYGKGVALQTTDRHTVEIILNDGRSENRWECDRDWLQAKHRHHLVVTVDGGPHIITFVADGVLCDGGDSRQFGWGRFSPYLYNVTGSNLLRIAPDVELLRLYVRPLRTSEAVANHRAWATPQSAGGGSMI